MTRFGGRALPRAVAALCGVAALLVGSAVGPASAETVSSIRAQEWWIDAMHAPDTIWKVSTGKGITVAVVDSGVKASHPDLVGQVLPGQNFSGLPGGATADVDKEGHGTAMASLIAGTGKGWGGKGMYGLAPGVKILPLRVVGKGANEAVYSVNFAKQLSAAIRAAADSKAQIINISMGQMENEANVRNAVNYALGKGKLIVAAVGNDAQIGNTLKYPASLPGVVGVGSIDAKGDVPKSSEYGPEVALTAPGEGMYNACISASGYCSSGGTSNATAIVSASAALVWSVHRDWTADQVIRVLKNTSDQGDTPGEQNPYYGYGNVRPRIALTKPGDPGPADVNPLVAGATASPTPSAA
ncbi:MAG TPA: type VII secretion-associated serine protease mycosin, partial [Streptosporangiaceae bacterium]|nr:type VII secretion-associated serine protease mycosin [Streptosporangiaceae bacterium]